jgi:tRNA pseudouridine38-40 synthase
MERYQVKIAYDGTNFQGFQRQGSQRTVQSVLESALRQLDWKQRAILYAGRTDTGVHAAGQVIAFDLDWNHTTGELCNALNAHLPIDVAASEVRVVASDFHPRFNALARCYRYRIYNKPVRDPLREHYAWRVWPELNGDLIKQASEKLEGTFDFAAFGSPVAPGGTTIRTVHRACWEQAGDEWYFEVIANAFLYRMVRRIVFLQVQVGKQRLDVDTLAAALQFPKPLTPGLAKPNGLVLERVYYFEDRQLPEGLIQPLSVSGEEDCG